MIVRLRPQGIRDRCIQFSVLLKPSGGACMQCLHTFPTFLIQPLAQHVGKERVITIPDSFNVERHEEEVLFAESLEGQLGIVLFRHSRAQRTTQSIEDRGL